MLMSLPLHPLLAVCRKISTSPLSTRESDIFLADRLFAGVSLDAGTRSQMLNYHLHMSSHVESDGSKRRWPTILPHSFGFRSAVKPTDCTLHG